MARNGLVAFTESTPDHPADVAVLRGGKTQRLTRLNDDLFTGKALARVEPLATVSSYDRKPVGAWIATPPNLVARAKTWVE